jgi:hypothetical protein
VAIEVRRSRLGQALRKLRPWVEGSFFGGGHQGVISKLGPKQSQGARAPHTWSVPKQPEVG